MYKYNYVNLSFKYNHSMLLYNDAAMEIVSMLLDHSSMTVTQDSYGKIVQKKISIEWVD